MAGSGKVPTSSCRPATTPAKTIAGSPSRSARAKLCLVEAHLRQREVHGVAEVTLARAGRIDEATIAAPRAGDGARRAFGAEQAGQRHRGAGAQVDDTAPGGVVSGMRADARVGVVLEREEGAVHVEQRDVRRRHHHRVVGHRVVGTERILVGVRGGVGVRDSIHQRVGEHGRGVVGDQVARIDELPHQQRVVVRTVVVGHVQLVEPAPISRQHERRPAHPRPVGAVGDPVGRVARHEQELRGGWRRGGGADARREQEQQGEAGEHGTKIQRRREPAQGRAGAGPARRHAHRRRTAAINRSTSSPLE